MADAKVLDFLQHVEREPKLQAKVQAVEAGDTAFAELARIANDAGYAISAQALETGLRECSPVELSDDELDAVSGGTGAAKPLPTTLPKAPTAFGKFAPKLSAGQIQPCF